MNWGSRFTLGDFSGGNRRFFLMITATCWGVISPLPEALERWISLNAGAVNVGGLELLLNYNLLSGNSKWNLPVTFSYTYTDTAFQTDFGSADDLWGGGNCRGRNALYLETPMECLPEPGTRAL